MNFFLDRRTKLGLTQRDVALAMGMTTAAVSSWERGASAPRVTLAPKLAEIYQVDETRILAEISRLAQRVAAA